MDRCDSSEDFPWFGYVAATSRSWSDFVGPFDRQRSFFSHPKSAQMQLQLGLAMQSHSLCSAMKKSVESSSPDEKELLTSLFGKS